MARIVLEAATEAHLRPACDLLDAHGIPYRVNGSALSSLGGALPFSATAVTIEVLRDEDVEPARALIAAHERPEDEDLFWRCSACGEDSPGNFDACWKCRRTRPPGAAPAASSPYRGDRPPSAPADVAMAVAAPRATHLRNLAWALGLGFVPVVVTQALAWRALPPAPSHALKHASINIMAGLELALVLRWARHRGADLRALWRGSGGRLLSDVGLALILAGVLYGLRLTVDRGVGNLLHLSTQVTAIDPRSMFGNGLDIALLVAGISLAGSTGTLWLYGLVQRGLEGALRSRVAAVLLTSLVGTLLWAWGTRLPTLAAAFAFQLALSIGFVVGGRVRPLALAAIGMHLIRWIVWFSY